MRNSGLCFVKTGLLAIVELIFKVVLNVTLGNRRHGPSLD